MAAFGIALLPLESFPRTHAWYRRMNAIRTWAEAFEGLNAPALPEIPVRLKSRIGLAASKLIDPARRYFAFLSRDLPGSAPATPVHRSQSGE
jgi:hypothetical protein